LDEINRAGEEEAARLLTPLIERAPHVAKRVARRRPFRTSDQLCDAIRAELLVLDEAERVELFRSHPELATGNPLTMTRESQAEQGRLQLTAGSNAYQARLAAMNARYREKFGFPFIIALARHGDMESVMAKFEARLNADRATELDAAIEQVAAVSASRVAALLECTGLDHSGLDRSGADCQPCLAERT
jgi:OHCU decarboxylase